MYTQVPRITVHKRIYRALFNEFRVEWVGALTLSLLVSEHCAGALHVCLEQLCSSDKAGLLCRRKTRCLGFGTGCGTAADTRQILRIERTWAPSDSYADSVASYNHKTRCYDCNSTIQGLIIKTQQLLLNDNSYDTHYCIIYHHFIKHFLFHKNTEDFLPQILTAR